MATINLGSIKFNWKGAYSGATAYVVDDVVEYNGSSYICILASTGNLPTNATYFEQMSQAGTDGTDLTSTLTTQGDILYRDGSGLARLGAGTAGQVLQSGGTGANVSWTNVSSDYVKLAGVDTTTTASEYDFTQFMDDSVYSSYRITGIYKFTGSGGSLRARFLNNTTQYAGANDYTHAGYQAYRQTDNNNNALGANVDGDGKDYIFFDGWGANNSYDRFFEMDIVGKPTTSGRMTGFFTNVTGRDDSGVNYIFHDGSAGFTYQTGNIDGIKLYHSGGGQLGSFQATIWGLKK